jgi:hypothetical protein
MSPVVLLIAALGLAGWGCAGGSGSPPHPAGQPAAAPAPISEGTPEPIPETGGEEFNVTMVTQTGQFYVDNLEIEFNRRRGIHAVFGFYRDSFDNLVNVPFRDLSRIEFLGPMPSSLFDQARVGRENLNLSQDFAFRTRLTFKDQRQSEFFAFIPKLRGERDFTLWELSLSNVNNAAGIQYIEFNR